jgi:hypothetical protein
MPLALSDSALRLVMQAAAPLPVEKRTLLVLRRTFTGRIAPAFPGALIRSPRLRARASLGTFRGRAHQQGQNVVDGPDKFTLEMRLKISTAMVLLFR